MSDRLRIGIGIPSTGTWVGGFGVCLAAMVGYFERSTRDWPEDKRPEVNIIGIDGHLPDVRHRIVEEAIKSDCTHLLWLDCDMIFPVETLHMLLQHNQPVVGANYPRRTFPCIPTAHKGGGEEVGKVYTDDTKTGLEEVKHLGMGVCLMDMRVFDAVEPPWFVFEPYGKWGTVTRGEDVYFFEKLTRQAGIPAYVDHDLSRRVGHVGSFVYTHALANALRGREGGQPEDVAGGAFVPPDDRSAA